MPTYIHELPEWPHFTFDANLLLAPLSEARAKQGLLQGRLEGIGIKGLQEAQIESITSEAIKSSEIEGENLDLEKVRSSVARRLGLEQGGLPLEDHKIEGVVEMTMDAAHNWREPLTKERILKWQAGLFPGGYNSLGPVATGTWRDDKKRPMQIVSGAIGNQRIHFEAPKAKRIEKEIQAYLRWFERNDDTDRVIKAGVAHLWFETIHPFEDGNGRVGRAILDLALARADAGNIRCYSVSHQIKIERNEYYNHLEAVQIGSLDVTTWLVWFISCYSKAMDTSTNALARALERSAFWVRHSDKNFNIRQKEVISKMLLGWEGKMTVSKWAKMKKVSEKTAQRDLIELYEMGILRRESQGRGTGYTLAPLDE